MKTLALSSLALIVSMSPLYAQSPYAGEQQRSIKSLSTEEVDSLHRGDGMGLAKLAELNHFPGPKHVLQIADELGLDEAQRVATRALYDDMRNNAVAIGEQLIAAESALDQHFRQDSISPESLETALLEIGRLRAKLRYVHLEAHLRQKQLLSPGQIKQYDAVRGYGSDGHQYAGHSHTEH